MKRICLVCDVPNWAFDIIAHKVVDGLKEDFEMTIDYFDLRETGESFFEFLEAHKEYDLLHFFWRKTLLLMESEVFVNKVKEKYGDCERYIEQMRQKISTGVYDFLFLKEDEKESYCNVFNRFSKCYYVISQRLLAEYQKIEQFKKPWGVVHDIYNSEKMLPEHQERFSVEDRPLVVGWVGNSKIAFDGVDLKGFNTLIQPVVKELIQEGYNIVPHYADRNEKWRSPDEMPQYYNEIDVCICASIMEGTPMPILESMSCGDAIITTDVGIVREALGELQQQFIIGDREYGKNDAQIKKKLKEKIVQLYRDRELLRKLSEENLQSIVRYDGGKIIEEYRRYFTEALA